MSGGGPLDEVLDYYFSVHQDIQNIEIVSVEHQNIVQIFKKKLQPPPQQQSPPPPPLQPQQQSPPPPPSQPQPQPSVTWSVDTFELNPTKNNHPTNTNGATSYLKVSFTISYILDEEKQQIKKDIQEVINNALQDNQAIVQNLATNLVPEPQEYEITIINKKVFDEKDNIYKKLKSEINRFFPGAGPHTDVSLLHLKKSLQIMIILNNLKLTKQKHRSSKKSF